MLSTSEREKSENGEGRDVYATLLQSDTVQSYGRTKVVGHAEDILEKNKKTNDATVTSTRIFLN